MEATNTITKPLNLAVILNGPPNSGKDTLADALEPYGFEKQMFKTALYEQTAYYLQMDLDRFKQQATNRITKEEKTLIHPTQGVEFSPREAMIHVSEHMIKPHCGKDFFGIAAAQRCLDHKAQLAVFSDGGFKEELRPLEGIYEHIVVIRLYRDDCSFDNDSRTYFDGTFNCHDVELINGDIQHGVDSILKIINPYLTGSGSMNVLPTDETMLLDSGIKPISEIDPLDFTEDTDFIDIQDSYLDELPPYVAADPFDMPIEYE